MAKIALCGYGSKGDGIGKTENGYAYVVNDGVRSGDRLQVVATSRAKRKFATTAVSRHVYGEDTVKGREAQADAINNSGEVITAYRGKDLGIKGVSKKTPDHVPPELEALGQKKPQSPYAMTTRGGNLARYMQENGETELTKLGQKEYETYDDYAKKFM